MKLSQSQDKQSFTAAELSFSELKTMRDALKAHAKSGSTQAGKMAAEIETALSTMQV